MLLAGAGARADRRGKVERLALACESSGSFESRRCEAGGQRAPRLALQLAEELLRVGADLHRALARHVLLDLAPRAAVQQGPCSENNAI